MEREEEFERDFSDAVKEALRIETAWKGNNEARKAAVDRISSDVPAVPIEAWDGRDRSLISARRVVIVAMLLLVLR